MKKKIITQLTKNTDIFSASFKKDKTWMLVFDPSTKNVRSGVGFSEYSSGTKFFYWVFPDVCFPFIFPYSLLGDVDVSDTDRAHFLGKGSSPSESELIDFILDKCKLVRESLALDYTSLVEFLSANYDRLSSFEKADYILLRFYIERDFMLVNEAEKLVPKLNPHNPKTIKFRDFIQLLKSQEESKIINEIELFKMENEKVWQAHFFEN
ncbi:hypothetical protein [Pseudoalteromonas rubra]|uniref:Uncharacterized protein n=1 Tax=Pseudoalteromonas rubra TaxID=43658 RepID=A0A0U3GZI2_9GAMM|nr:hypothetical protein [Pseudoalteromonas rubra]ALU44499.1 hypothetical protein AT705_17120 [Pseudoalteromonas rubra]